MVSQGTVLRIDLSVPKSSAPSVRSITAIGTGFSERTDPAALVIGPTGVALSKNNKTLYVADSLNNRIAVITDPLTRTMPSGPGNTLSSGGSLNDPLGVTVAPNGHLLVVNGNDGFVTEITAHGTQVASKLIDNNGTPPGAGALFGILFDTKKGVVFVDDATNTLNILH